MTQTLLFLPEVEDDAIRGYAWYETKSDGLGEEFLRMFYACAGDLLRNSLFYRKVYGEFRRCLLRRFPFAIYYMIKGEQVIVTGLFHCARDPRIVEKELGGRRDPERPL
jgi:toxin ParE1/3/4